MKKNCLFIILNFITVLAFSQSAPYMVKDIDTSSTGASMFSNFTDLNGTLIMTGQDSLHGRELWRSDGTVQGTYMIKDIDAGPASSSPSLLLKFGNVVLFFVRKSYSTYDLWKTDGTAAGTVLVKDNISMANDSTDEVTIANFTATTTTAFFTLTSASQEVDLWKTNGAAQGTQFYQKFTTYNAGYFTGFGNFLYYIAYNYNVTINGQVPAGLYRTDGTANGTVVLDTTVGWVNLLPAKNYLYYWKNQFYGLCRTDGTVEGTKLVKANFYPNVLSYACIGDSIFMAATDTSLYNADYELWMSDGERAELVKNINPTASSGPQNFFSDGKTVYFYAKSDSSSSISSLWKTDGTVIGTSLIKKIENAPEYEYQRSFVAFNNKVYFSDIDSAHGWEFWVTDGSSGGTMLVKDINPGTASALMGEALVVSGNHIFFNALEASGQTGLYSSDGTAQGTTLLVNPLKTDAASTFSNFVTLNSGIYFFDNYNTTINLYKSDGTDEGTVLVKSFSSYVLYNGIIDADSLFYFVLFNNDSTLVWESDGTAAGTRVVYQTPSITHCERICVKVSSIYEILFVGGTLYFTIGNEGATQLYRLTGSPGGGQKIGSLLDAHNLTDLNGKLIFAASTDGYNTELYISDGTDAGTKMIKDIYPGDTGSGPVFLKAANNRVYFDATTPNYGQELWRTDGTDTGTVMVKDITPGPANSIVTTTPSAFNKGYFYFTVSITSNDTKTISYLWKTDGTDTGTQPVLTTTNDTLFVYPFNYTWVQMGNKVCVEGANTEANAYNELWCTDGTAKGTYQVYSQPIGNNGYSEPEPLLGLDSVFFFKGDNGINGGELWISNGDPYNSLMVADINPGYAYSNPSNMFYYKGAVYFTADDGVHGVELWRYDISNVSFNTTSIIPSSIGGSSNEVLIYPNPGNGIYTIKFAGEKPAALAVYNSLGAVVKTQPVQGEGTVTVDISQCPAGMYMICSPQGDINLSQKIIKE